MMTVDKHELVIADNNGNIIATLKYPQSHKFIFQAIGELGDCIGAISDMAHECGEVGIPIKEACNDAKEYLGELIPPAIASTMQANRKWRETIFEIQKKEPKKNAKK